MLEFVPFTDIDDADWNRFVDECDEAWVEHRSERVTAGTDLGHCWAAVAGSRLVAICVLYESPYIRGTRLSGPGVAVRWPYFSQRWLGDIQDRLRANAGRVGACTIWMDFPHLAPAHQGLHYNVPCQFKLGLTNSLPWGDNLVSQPSLNIVIDLSLTLTEIEDGFSRSAKRELNRAKNERCEFHVLYSSHAIEHYEVFKLLHHNTLRRTASPLRSEEWHTSMKRCLSNGLASLVLCHVDDTTVGALLLHHYKGSVSEFATGVSDEFFQRGIMTLIKLEAMHEMQKRGEIYYSIGPYFPLMKGSKMGNIGEYKKRLGGMAWPNLCGEQIINPDLHARQVIWPQIAPFIIKSRPMIAPFVAHDMMLPAITKSILPEFLHPMARRTYRLLRRKQ